MLNIARFMFFCSLILMGFGYGAAAVKWKIFPYSVLRDAMLAFEAWSEVWAHQFEDRNKLPFAFERFEPNAAPHPTVTIYAEDWSHEDDLVLISGGPWQLLNQCPHFGCMAWLIDRTGKVRHTWEVDLDKLWENTSHLSGKVNKLGLYPVGMHLFDNGDLIITFQAKDAFPYGAGIIRVDQFGEIIWKRQDYSHHWPTADWKGRIYTPAVRIIDAPVTIGVTGEQIKCRTGKIREDIVRVLSPEGHMLEEISVLETLATSDYAGLLHALRDQCDPTHLNSVDVVPARIAGRVKGIEEGDLLISLRSPSLVAVLDRTSGKIKRAVIGRTIEQHSPHFLPDGRIVVFDNRGGAKSEGGSRVLRIDLETAELQQLFPTSNSTDFLPVSSATAGHIDVSETGTRILVSFTGQGRVLEIDVQTGTVLWEFNNFHDIAEFLRESAIESDTSIALFHTYGAYYAGQPSFLD